MKSFPYSIFIDNAGLSCIYLIFLANNKAQGSEYNMRISNLNTHHLIKLSIMCMFELAV